MSDLSSPPKYPWGKHPDRGRASFVVVTWNLIISILIVVGLQSITPPASSSLENRNSGVDDTAAILDMIEFLVFAFLFVVSIFTTTVTGLAILRKRIYRDARWLGDTVTPRTVLTTGTIAAARAWFWFVLVGVPLIALLYYSSV
jgi:hypothetical protein